VSLTGLVTGRKANYVEAPPRSIVKAVYRGLIEGSINDSK